MLFPTACLCTLTKAGINIKCVSKASRAQTPSMNPSENQIPVSDLEFIFTTNKRHITDYSDLPTGPVKEIGVCTCHNKAQIIVLHLGRIDGA